MRAASIRWSRFRSIHRAVLFAVAVSPIVALNVAGPNGVILSLDALWGVLWIFGPALVAALGMAYALERLPLAWLCVIACVVTFGGLHLAYLSASESSTAGPAFIWVIPAYVGICLAGWGGERQYEWWRWRRARS